MGDPVSFNLRNRRCSASRVDVLAFQLCIFIGTKHVCIRVINFDSGEKRQQQQRMIVLTVSLIPPLAASIRSISLHDQSVSYQQHVTVELLFT